jgi:hypothetical protein
MCDPITCTPSWLSHVAGHLLPAVLWKLPKKRECPLPSLLVMLLMVVPPAAASQVIVYYRNPTEVYRLVAEAVLQKFPHVRILVCHNKADGIIREMM